MFTTDQTHLRRYLATLGVAISAGTLSLAGFFLKLQQDLIVTRSTLAKLTPGARAALLQRQNYLSIGTTILPWFALIGFCGGLVLGAYGMVGWARRQKVIDEREDIGLSKERVELLQLTEREKTEKLEHEAKESAKESTYAPSGPSRTRVSIARDQIITAEAALVKKLGDLYDEGEVLSSVGLRDASGYRFELDALVRTNRREILFELKYASTYINVTKRMLDGLTRLARATRVAKAKGVLVIVVSDNESPDRLTKLRAQGALRLNEYPSVLGIYIGRFSDFLALSGKDFAAEVGLDSLGGKNDGFK